MTTVPHDSAGTVDADTAAAGPTSRSWSAWAELTKLKLTSMASLPGALAYLAALDEPVSAASLPALLFGTLASASGAAALNEWSERRIDGKMRRTRGRPLPAGTISPSAALLTGFLLLFAGIAILGFVFNALAALLAAAAAAVYWLIYTPLKRVTPWCTEVGAISGALPPMIGWSAAGNGLGELGWMFFGILFLWQMPHFHPIAWRYRHDYREAGLRMRVLYGVPQGNQAANHSILYAALLPLATALPFFSGYTGGASQIVCLAMAAAFIGGTIRFRFSPDRDRSARQLFRLSLIYLPIVLISLVLDLRG